MANMTDLLGNPWVNLGMNVFANNEGSALQGVGKGFQQYQAYNQQQEQMDLEKQNAELMNQYRQLQMAQVARELATPVERKIIKDAQGRSYYADTKEPVFEGEKLNPETEVGKLLQAMEMEQDPNRRAYYQRALDKKVSDGSVTKVYDPTSPSGVRYVPTSQAAGQPAYQASGMQLTTNPDGSVSFSMGGGNSQMGTKGQNEIDQKIIDSTEMLTRLNTITNSMRPEALTFQGRLSEDWLSLKDRFANGKMDPAETEKLTEYTRFKQDALTNLNRTLNELSGAAVSPQEFSRIAASLPNTGEGLFDGDSPTQFMAKLENATRLAKAAIIRYNYAKSRGMNPMQTGIDLADVDSLIDTRGEELEQQMRQQYPNASQQDIESAVGVQIQQEFGL